MEIRPKVAEYVRLRIEALRKENPGSYQVRLRRGNSMPVVTPPPPLSCPQNAGVIRSNSMRYMPNFFPRASVEKIFFCFPDPHFKVRESRRHESNTSSCPQSQAKKHRRRIVSETLLSEYAYLLKPNAFLYCITDVEDLHNWHVAKVFCAQIPPVYSSS